MIWTTKLIIAIALTTITGTILFAVWYWIGKLLERMGYVNIMYWLLRLLLVFWFIPFAYLTLALRNTSTEEEANFLFFYTDILTYVSIGLIGIWLLIVLRSSIKYIWRIHQTNRRFQDAFVCEAEVNAYFEEICNKLRIKNGRVKLLQSYKARVPSCVGTFRPAVVIPVQEYSQEELEVIFVHELMHYKHKDQWLKHLTFIASCVHCFNPAMKVLKKKVDLWGEYACDYASVKVIGSMKKYFQVVLDMAETEDEVDALYSPLVEKQSEIMARIEQMKRSQNMKVKSKWKAMLCVITMFVTSTTSVYGATTTAENMYLEMYDATVDEVQELSQTVTDDGYIEYEVTGIGADVVEEEGQVIQKDRSGSNYHFGWSVPKDYSKRGAAFSASAGGTISLTAVASPSNVTYHLGIVQPNGVRRYVSGTHMMSHTFSLTQTGTYYVYVQNMSSTTGIEVSGGYAVE